LTEPLKQLKVKKLFGPILFHAGIYFRAFAQFRETVIGVIHLKKIDFSSFEAAEKTDCAKKIRRKQKVQIFVIDIFFPLVRRFSSDRSIFLSGTIRVARWYILKPKIPAGFNFGGNRKGWYIIIIWPFGIHYSHLVHFMVIW
jgi:hypothetical protein